jgi:hypothetical protein
MRVTGEKMFCWWAMTSVVTVVSQVRYNHHLATITTMQAHTFLESLKNYRGQSNHQAIIKLKVSLEHLMHILRHEPSKLKTCAPTSTWLCASNPKFTSKIFHKTCMECTLFDMNEFVNVFCAKSRLFIFYRNFSR